MTILDFIAARLSDAQPSIDRVRSSMAASPLGRCSVPYADRQVTHFEAMEQMLCEAQERGYPSDPVHDDQVRNLAMRWIHHRGYTSAVSVKQGI